MRLLPSYAALALTAVCAGIVGTAQAETIAWSGCVTHGGSIIDVTQGYAPLKECAKKHRLIHFNDETGPAGINPGALYDQENLCKALHALGLDGADPDALAALGCHTESTSPQPIAATLQVITPDMMRATAPDYIVDGLLSIEPNALPGIFQYVLKKSYNVSTTVFPQTTGLVQTECQKACTNDPECIAAFVAITGDELQFCHTFHQSDSLTTDWIRPCGNAIDKPAPHFSCVGGLKTQKFWIKSENLL
jgi:hypothetical protein